MQKGSATWSRHPPISRIYAIQVCNVLSTVPDSHLAIFAFCYTLLQQVLVTGEALNCTLTADSEVEVGRGIPAYSLGNKSSCCVM